MTPKPKSEKDSKIEDAVSRIARENEKDYGKFVIEKASVAASRPVLPLSTGVLSVDLALGRGGFLKGRIAEIGGAAKHGKTSLLLSTISESQKAGYRTAYVDAEHKLDLLWAEKLGVNLSEMTLISPDHAEQALDAIEGLTCAGMDLIIVDSVAALTPRAELEGGMDEANMGVAARLMGKAMRKLNGEAARSGTAILFINQEREKIGVVYGPNKTTPGGKALEFYASVRVKVRRTDWIKEGEKTVGARTMAKIEANQVAAPMEEAAFDIYWGKCECHAPGIDKAADLLECAVAAGIVEKAGSWFSLGGEKLGQGRIEAAANLSANEEVAKKVRNAILNPKVK